MSQALELRLALIVKELAAETSECRLDALDELCAVVGSAYGADGAAVGTALREGGGIAALLAFLLDKDAAIAAQAMHLIANLCSDAVDVHSERSKLELLELPDSGR